MTHNSGSDRNNTDEIVGSRFMAGPETNVTHLGFYDDNADGLAEDHEVGIFEADTGVVVAQATVPAGDESLLAYNCRWVELELPVTLVQGQSYILAARVFDGGDIFLNSNPDVRESTFGAGRVAEGTNVVSIWDTGGGEFSAPANALGNAHYNRSYMAGNFASFESREALRLSVDNSIQYQKIESFGASDAWNLDFVGKHWSDAEKELMAKRLFGTSKDESGNPEGIGLSGWRFNIGAGSSEQADASGIGNVTRRTECFLLPDGSYDWSKQLGQQWFMEKAAEYGVQSFTAFTNSAPVYYTKNGFARGTNGQTNLKDEHYDEYAEFLATVLKHFQDEGRPFQFISPVNEPQYDWDSNSQEGSHWEIEEIVRLAKELDTALKDKGVTAKQTLDETAQYDYAYSGGNKIVGHIEAYFNPERSTYIGNLDTVDQSVSAHSYWTYYTNQQLVSQRSFLANELENWGVPLRQTEYSLLGLERVLEDEPETHTDFALFMAKVIHADLTVANAISWAFWTSAEQDRFGHKNRFLLMTLTPTSDTDLTSGGVHTPEKTLWMLGNYSRFVRPGYRRVNVSNADDYDGLLGSAYVSPDEGELVLVLQNRAYEAQAIALDDALSGLPFDYERSEWYLTDREHDLRFQGAHDLADAVSLPARSVSTFVVPVAGWSKWSSERLSEVALELRDAHMDPDSDGISNLFEYLSGGDPVGPNQTKAFGAGESVYSLVVGRMATDVGLRVEYSTDLDQWQSFELKRSNGVWTAESEDFEISQESIGEDLDMIRLRYTGVGAWFARVKASLN